MLFISAEDNALDPGVAELHMQPGESVTVILADGSELYVSGDGTVADTFGNPLTAS